MGAFEDTLSVRIGDLQLAYRERGAGEPLLLVHGGASDMRTWGTQLEAFSSSFRTIAYSRRYSPPGEPIPAGVDDPMGPHVDDLIALVDELGSEPAHVVGHSWGGFIVLLAATRRPDLFRSLVLIEPPALTLFVSAKPKPPEILRLLFTRPRTAAAVIRFGARVEAPARKAFEAGDDQRGVEIFGRGVLGREAFENAPPEKREEIADNVPTMKAQLLGAGFPPISDADVEAIAAPTLLLGGERSNPLFPRILDRLEELLPDTRRVTIPGATHSPHEQQPAATNEAIVGFVRGLGG